MSANHQCLSINGVQMGDLISVGSRFTFFTVRQELNELDGMVFASADEVKIAVKAALLRQSPARDRLRSVDLSPAAKRVA